MEEKVKILIADDEESILGMLSEVLTDDGYDVTTATSAEEALEHFKSDPFPLVFTDIRMSGMNGIELLQQIRNISKEAQVVVITSHASIDTAITALREGAYDYMMKPFEDIDIISVVAERALEKFRLIEDNMRLIADLKIKNMELEEANSALSDLAVRDGLTGVYNHRYFHEAFMTELERANRYRHPLSLLFIDVDHFKDFNDTHGHQRGDQALIDIASIIQGHVRNIDIVARYGGEEFVVLLSETENDEALKVAEKLRRSVEDHPMEGAEAHSKVKITISTGVSTSPDNGSKTVELIKYADKALYRAKNGGRNAVCS
ncbi:MAG: diguanylate cyclase [Proteobacteria bacterium]|nr:diguanylate cyclase [Pseudomonadota bacterium]